MGKKIEYTVYRLHYDIIYGVYREYRTLVGVYDEEEFRAWYGQLREEEYDYYSVEETEV